MTLDDVTELSGRGRISHGVFLNVFFERHHSERLFFTIRIVINKIRCHISMFNLSYCCYLYEPR